MSDLLPCPFCGHSSPEYDSDGGFVTCASDTCGTMGPTVDAEVPSLADYSDEQAEAVKRKASELWNKRAHVPQPPRIPCEFPDCPDEAAYEGWYRRRDPFLGTPIGHIVKIAFCEGHKTHPHLCVNEPKCPTCTRPRFSQDERARWCSDAFHLTDEEKARNTKDQPE